MASKNTLIIGKRSNLSRALASRVADARLIASDELHTLPALLVNTGSSDLIYNVYHKSALLGQTDTPEVYAKYAFTTLAAFVSLCLEHHRHINTVIFTSTSAVYGNNAHAAETDKTDITNLYASLKLASEFFLKDHLKNTSIRLIIPRVFNMYGGDDEFSVVSKIAAATVSGREIAVTNNGRSVRDFIHISDVVEIYWKLLQSSCDGVVNVGTGSGVSVEQLIEMAEAAFGRTLHTSYTNRDEIARSVARIDLLTRTIGHHPFKTVDSYYCDYTQQKIAAEKS
jgi:nucleoside-diphosphate-sugar epimerase